MPRSSRLDAPGALHHVMGRGIERKEIFIDNKDRGDFITRLTTLADDGSMDIYAFALLPNHFHLLCKTKKRPLSSSMRKLLTDTLSDSIAVTSVMVIFSRIDISQLFARKMLTYWSWYVIFT